MRQYATPHPLPCSLVVLALALLCLPARAQVSTDDPSEEPYRAGAWALQFQIQDQIGLGAFQGGTISAKHHLTDRKAVRFGASLSGLLQDSDDAFEGEKAQRRSALNLDFQYLVHAAPQRAVRWYAGGGPRLTFNSHGVEFPSAGGKNKNSSQIFGGGLSGVVGAEWIVHRHFGLMAQYGTHLTVTRHTTNSEREDDLGVSRNTGERGETIITFGPSPVRFGLSVYF